MANKLLLRYLIEHKLDPKVKYVAERGKLVPAIKKQQLHVESTTLIHDIVETTSVEAVNEQITDAVTQLEVVVEEKVEFLEQEAVVEQETIQIIEEVKVAEQENLSVEKTPTEEAATKQVVSTKKKKTSKNK